MTPPGPARRPAKRDASVVCLALPAAPTTATGPRRPPPRRAADAEHAMAQHAAPPDYPSPASRSWERNAAPRRARWRQRRRAHDTPHHAAAGAWDYHHGPASRRELTSHQPPRTGPPVGTDGRTTAAWDLACRRAGDGLVWRYPSVHGACRMGSSCLVCFFSGPRQETRLRAAAQRWASGAAGSRRLHALVRPAALGYHCESFENSQSCPCLTLWGTL